MNKAPVKAGLLVTVTSIILPIGEWDGSPGNEPLSGISMSRLSSIDIKEKL